MTVTTPTHGTVCNPNDKASHGKAKICTKFEVSRISRYGDILGRSKKLNESPDHNYAPFGGDFLFVW